MNDDNSKRTLFGEQAIVRLSSEGLRQRTPVPSPSPPVYPTFVEKPLEIRGLVQRVLKRKFQIAIVALLVVIPTMIATFLMTPTFRSTAVIQFNFGGARVLPYGDITDRAGGESSYESQLLTQEQILRSESFANRVSQRLKADLGNETNGKERFEVRRIASSQLFQVSCLAGTPTVAAKAVNLYAEEYIKQHYESRQATVEKTRHGLQRELEALEKKLQASEKNLVDYARSKNIASLESGQTELVEKRLGIVDQQVAEIEAERAVAKGKVDAVESATLKDFPERYTTPVVQNLTTRLLALEHELTGLQASFGENWPAVIQKRSEISLTQAQLEREKAAVLAQAREQAKMDWQMVESRYKLMMGSLKDKRGLVNEYHDASIPYNILRREVDTSRKLYEGLLERLKQTGVMAGLEFGNIEIVEPGHPDSAPDSPKVLWNFSLASLLGLALGVCFAFVADFWNTSVSTLEEVDEISGLPALGSIPLFEATNTERQRLVQGFRKMIGTGSASEDLSAKTATSVDTAQLTPRLEEAIRTICASILLSRSDHEPRVIVVTSAEPAEGKTTIVSHLGRALADHGFGTLLVDADLRRPSLSSRFALGNEDGLSLFLSGHVHALPKINNTENPNLWVVTAGPKPPNPAALLNSEKLESFLKEMSMIFKFVIVDSPPLLAVADGRILGARADGVVLVVRAGRTQKTMVKECRVLLENSGANPLGVILNGAEPSSRSSYYYDYYTQ